LKLRKQKLEDSIMNRRLGSMINKTNQFEVKVEELNISEDFIKSYEGEVILKLLSKTK
jgi:hypothetical protein